jgi:uncharacterized protein YmfQ (DUF2313 family)
LADSALILKRWQAALRSLFPRGKAWDAKEDSASNISKLINALGQEACRLEVRAFDLLNEIDPRITNQLLTDWERLLNLPDECEPEPENLTAEQRRQRIVQVLTTSGGQNKQFFINLAANFGIAISVTDVTDQPPFRVGRSRVGDRLTNGPWTFAFVISAPFENATRFRVGISRVGQRLVDVSNPTLECLINKHKPAHTIAILTFTGEF